MRVKLSKVIGFCFGVERAINIAESALRGHKDVHSLGPVIHNRQVVDRLSKSGLKVVKDVDKIKRGVVIVTSHGISPKITEKVRRRKLCLIDTTCPFVLNAQKIASSLSGDGYKVIIVGDAQHPEVKALVDFASGDVSVVKDVNEARALRLNPNKKISIISQTTQSIDNFLDVVKAILDKKPKDIKIINTICKDVEDRQKAATRLAREVDLMLIVGGRNSANTRRLLEVCKRICDDSHLVETEEDLRDSWFRPNCMVGVVSGASTPDWIVKRVVDKINSKFKSQN